MGWRFDPGPCPVCGAAHSACSTSSGPIVIPQTPGRDAATAREVSVPSEVSTSFTTGTYRGKKKA